MSEPTQPAPFSSAHIVNGEVVHCHTKRCWGCILGQCPGGVHTWADLDDIAHAESTGRPDPSDQRCGCDCTNRPAVAEPEPDWDWEPLALEPCALCGEVAACGYDAEGRPMIHTDSVEDET